MARADTIEPAMHVIRVPTLGDGRLEETLQEKGKMQNISQENEKMQEILQENDKMQEILQKEKMQEKLQEKEKMQERDLLTAVAERGPVSKMTPARMEPTNDTEPAPAWKEKSRTDDRLLHILPDLELLLYGFHQDTKGVS